MPRESDGMANELETVENRLQITRVVIENFLSIAECDVRLERITFLVGRNGSGKSNFLDALRFVSESLRHTIDHAFDHHYGILGVLRQSQDAPEHFGVRLDCHVGSLSVQYGFIIGLEEDSEFRVRREECRVVSDDSPSQEHRYSVRDGQVIASFPNPPPASSRRLYLVTVSGLNGFRPVYEALSRMEFYHIRPDAVELFQKPTSSAVLKSDGANLTRMILRMENRIPRFKRRIEQYLRAIVPSLVGVSHTLVGSYYTLEFHQQDRGTEPLKFFAESMSHGTLRALGVLVALFQCADSTGPYLVGIEEPEDGLHPVATEVLVDSMFEASLHTQVIVTSHSTDLLDHPDISAESILVANAYKGGSRIGPLDDAGRSALKDQLCTIGELMRMNQLQISHAVAEQRPYRSVLFDSMA